MAVRHISEKLSDWEVAEMYIAYRRGVPKRELSERYGISGSTLNDTIRRFERAWHDMREAMVQT